MDNPNGYTVKGFNFAPFGAFSLKVLALLLVAIAPIKSTLIATGFLVIADFASGIWASIKEGKPITSSGMRRTIIKGLAYQVAIIVAFLLETYMMDGIPVVKTFTALIGLTEGKSFFENFNRITGIDVWSTMIAKLNLTDIKTPDDKK